MHCQNSKYAALVQAHLGTISKETKHMRQVLASANWQSLDQQPNSASQVYFRFLGQPENSCAEMRCAPCYTPSQKHNDWLHRALIISGNDNYPVEPKGLLRIQ
jgi:hypothetical protein